MLKSTIEGAVGDRADRCRGTGRRRRSRSPFVASPNTSHSSPASPPGERLEPMRLAVDLEDEVAGRGSASCVPSTSGTWIVRPGVGSRRAASRHAGSTGQWSIPSNSRRCGASRVPGPNREPAAALDEAQPQRAELEHRRLGPRDRSSGARSRTGAPVVHESAVGGRVGAVIGNRDRAGERRAARQDDLGIVGRCRSGWAGFSQPSPASVSQPISLRRRAIPLLAPRLHARDVRRIGTVIPPAGR